MPRRIAAKITGVGGYVPPRVMTNAELEKLVETNDAWIRERTGIRERHVAEKGVASSDLATAAARQVLAARNIPATEIDLIVVASVTPDMMFPATACLVQNNLGAKHAWGFDLSAACSGFVYALTVGAQFVGARTQNKALVIGSDVMTSILNYQDRATCVLFGDGAGAVLLEPTDRDDEGILTLFMKWTALEENIFSCRVAARFILPHTTPSTRECTISTRRARRSLDTRCAAWRTWLAKCWNETDSRARIWRWSCRTRRTCESFAPCRSGSAWTTPRSWSTSSATETRLAERSPWDCAMPSSRAA